MDFRDFTTDLFAKLCIYIPHVLIASCIITILYLASTENYNYLYKSLIIIIPSIIYSIILIWKQKLILNLTLDDINPDYNLNIRQSLLYKIYAILFIFAFVWLIYSQARDAIFIILIVALYSISIIHIFSSKGNSWKFILLELFITSVLFCSSEIISHAYTFLGTIDVNPHRAWTEALFSSGHIQPMGEYNNFPLMHITATIISLLSGTSAYLSLYIELIISVLIGIFFIYFIAQYFTNSKKISLLIVFSYIILGTLTSSVSIFPTYLCLTAFIILLYLFLMDTEKIKTPIRLLLAVIVTLYLMQVHHATILLILGTVVILLFIAFMYHKKLNKPQVIILTVSCVLSGLYFAVNYLNNMMSTIMYRLGGASDELFETPIIQPIQDAVSTSGITQITSDVIDLLKNESAIDFPVYQVNCIISVILIAFFLFGIYFILSSKNKFGKISIIGPFVLVFLPIFIFGIAEASNVLMNEFLIGRWRIVFRPMFAIGAGIGIWVLLNVLGNIFKSKRVVTVITIGLLILLVIAGPVIHDASDSDIFSKDNIGGSKYYYNVNELVMVNFIADNLISNVNLISDYPMLSYADFTSSIMKPNYNTDMLSLFIIDNFIPSNNAYILFREQIYLDNYLLLIYGSRTGNVLKLNPTEKHTITFNKNIFQNELLYHNGKSLIYY